jgi:hypothetical protein
MPQPIHHFIDGILQKQNALNSKIRKPHIDPLAVLLLSCHVDSVYNEDEESMIMNFFGVFWVFASQAGVTGFFETEEEARRYAGPVLQRPGTLLHLLEQIAPEVREH